ncbi:alpha/beta fold hydrolase [Aquimarina sp. W85]|uniref:alpha/beta fold hydrolase n=1 Tax=Aquimarina rhodophyticola TaxID=3342246 RepID=UPI00366F322C
MNYRIFILLISLTTIIGCKPYETTKVRKNQITYDEFRLQQRTFPSQDGVIKYIDKGNGPVIVLLHGVPTSGWLYRKMIDPLVSGGYRVVVPDMLGFGSSDSPEGFDIYNEQNHAKRLLELMEGLGVEKWTQVVHDAGGVWTWELIKSQPHRIENLVLLNTVIFDNGFYPPIQLQPGIASKTKMWSYRKGIATNNLFKKLFDEGLQENTLNHLDVEGYKIPLTEGKTDALYYYYSETCNTLPDYRDVFESFNVPTMVIWGIHDTMLQWPPQQISVANSFAIKEEAIHIIDEKHFVQETKAKKISYLIRNFLSSDKEK